VDNVRLLGGGRDVHDLESVLDRLVVRRVLDRSDNDVDARILHALGLGRTLAAVADVVHDEYQREIVRTAEDGASEDDYSDIETPQYEHHKEVILDVITLDSTSCAPCQYMMDAVERAAEAAFVKVYINEHKIKARAGLGMMKKLGVRNLPAICIDGDLVFSSIIPDQKTLTKAIEARAIQKNILSLAGGPKS
jgi:uroporphyrinogen decarboxylase